MFLWCFWPASLLFVPTALSVTSWRPILHSVKLILNEMKTHVTVFGSLCRQQALSASLMIDMVAGNVLQLVDQFNEAKI